MPKVEIYTKVFCPYCHRAKALLERKGAAFKEVAVDRGGEEKERMIERSGGRRTVPQIFIDGKHVGGCDDLFALDANGGLDALLAA